MASMALNRTYPESNGPRSSEYRPSDLSPVPPQAHDKTYGRHNLDGPSVLVGHGENCAKHVVPSSHEQEEKLAGVALDEQTEATTSHPKREAPHPQLMAHMEQYKRMEECLYKHRKEWESQGGPGSWCMFPEPREYGRSMPNGPWTHNWCIDSDRRYQRPDPFDPSHSCIPGNHDDGNTNPYDDFDHVVDYGGRRERLRKNFEWEMDRLFLAEETERRRRVKLDEARKQRRQTDNTAESGELQGQGDKSSTTIDNLVDSSPAITTYTKPKLNRLDWFAFKEPDIVTEKDVCVIDVLIGEPVPDSSRGYRGWYGDSGRPVPQLDRLPDCKDLPTKPPGQTPLPERVRIHSLILLRIIYRILGSEGTSLVNGKRFPVLTSPVVMTRPFRVLTHCEQGLRDWCTALEKKFSAGQAPQESDKDRINVSVINESEQKEKDDANNVTKSSTALEHLKCLLSFMDSDILPRQAYVNGSNCRKVFFSDLWLLFRPGAEVIGSDGKQAYRVINTTSIKHHIPSVWQQQGWQLPSANMHHKTSFSVTCVYIDFDGKYVGPVRKVFDFKSFEGEKDIESLEVYPLRFHPLRASDLDGLESKEFEALRGNKWLRQKLIRRGAKFLDVAAVKHMDYAGPTLVVRDEVESQVVVDFETAFSVEGQHLSKPDLGVLLGNHVAEDAEGEEPKDSCRGPCCRDDDVHDDRYVDQRQTDEYIDSLLPKPPTVDKHPSIAIIPRLMKELQTGPDSELAVSDDDLVIMSYRVFGFVLRSRKWAQLDLDYLTDVYATESRTSTNGDKFKKEKDQEMTTAFDRLVLEEGHRPMIVSLVAQHFRDKESTTGQRQHVDIVKGKGKGLILLLHGAPGVGKTSTAEGVAEMFKKPLFQITCGDLGTTAREVERALEINFNMANRWGCILLLDEADVFLAERTKEDFKRNGLVAAFLRVLEYYAGILFLTTNRIGDFDEAFTSRIHISLYYPALNQNKTVEVFKVNMDMIEDRFLKKGRQIDVDKVGIGSFACQHFVEFPQARWNGRQIRNACQTALALAEFEAQGKSPEAILKPDAVISLRVEHFKIVRNAYLEFSKYMNDLYGSNAARRAKEAKLRAIWVDENDRIVATQGMGGGMGGADKKAAFLLASRGQLHEQNQQQQPSQHTFHQQQAPLQQQQGLQQQYSLSGVQPQQQQQQYYHQYPNIPSPQSTYRDPAQVHVQAQQPLAHQPWSSPGTTGVGAPFQRPGEGLSQVSQQPRPLQPLPQQPQPQQQQQSNQNWFNQNIEGMYVSRSQGPHTVSATPPPNP